MSKQGGDVESLLRAAVREADRDPHHIIEADRLKAISKSVTGDAPAGRNVPAGFVQASLDRPRPFLSSRRAIGSLSRRAVRAGRAGLAALWPEDVDRFVRALSATAAVGVLLVAALTGLAILPDLQADAETALPLADPPILGVVWYEQFDTWPGRKALTAGRADQPTAYGFDFTVEGPVTIDGLAGDVADIEISSVLSRPLDGDWTSWTVHTAEIEVEGAALTEPPGAFDIDGTSLVRVLTRTIDEEDFPDRFQPGLRIDGQDRLARPITMTPPSVGAGARTPTSTVSGTTEDLGVEDGTLSHSDYPIGGRGDRRFDWYSDVAQLAAIRPLGGSVVGRSVARLHPTDVFATDIVIHQDPDTTTDFGALDVTATIRPSICCVPLAAGDERPSTVAATTPSTRFDLAVAIEAGPGTIRQTIPVYASIPVQIIALPQATEVFPADTPLPFLPLPGAGIPLATFNGTNSIRDSGSQYVDLSSGDFAGADRSVVLRLWWAAARPAPDTDPDPGDLLARLDTDGLVGGPVEDLSVGTCFVFTNDAWFDMELVAPVDCDGPLSGMVVRDVLVDVDADPAQSARDQQRQCESDWPALFDESASDSSLEAVMSVTGDRWRHNAVGRHMCLALGDARLPLMGPLTDLGDV